jgi:hypothetical protein
MLLLLFMGWQTVCQKVAAGESGLGLAGRESRAGWHEYLWNDEGAGGVRFFLP